MPIEVRILGPLELKADGRVLPLGGPKQRALLGLLLVYANETVSRDRLLEELWGEAAPPSVESELHVYLSRLRKLLKTAGAGGALVREAYGYRLQVEPEWLDAHRFERLVGRASEALAAGDAKAAADWLREALALWRGPALADLQSESFAIAAGRRLEEQRVAALEQRLEADLALGRDQELIAELETLISDYPYRERLRAQLMLALYRAGRRVEALDAYQQARQKLAAELGLEPGHELKELERAILTSDPALTLHADSRPHVDATRERSAATEAAVEREVRKLVTVLFCDIGRSTEAGEGLDPEFWRRVVGRCFEAVERVIVGHGGLVEQFVGDALLAVFGLPRAHEDDALRAVRAAVDIRQLLPALRHETGVELTFRGGINTGEVVAGGAHTLVAGDTVSVAARLGQEAGPEEILLGAETVRLLGTRAEVEPLAPRGKATATEAFRFLRPGVPPQHERSLFVGRERELALLGDAFQRASDERELHLVSLLGTAGIGKSRLASEFADSLPAGVLVTRGRCLSYGHALSYWPLVEVLRELGEPAQAALERIIEGGATSPQQLAWTVQQALEQAAREQPLVILLEDLHWAEPALLDLLDQVAELSRGAPILLLCLARPELLDARPAWGGGKLNATSVLLESLSSADCELLSALARPLEPQQRLRVVELAAGNPLFVEELTHFLAEGGDDRQLPPRIRALLQARLDLLPGRERLVLARAAVEGTVFHRGSLEILLSEDIRPELSPQLAALTRKELVRPARVGVEGEEEFHFRHQLIRDAAYAAIPKGERGPLHERFAEWLEERSGEREELAEIGAYHLERAALYGRELGAGEPELEARASSALAAAGERARLRGDLQAAAGLWRRALALLEGDNARVPELELGLALVLRYVGEFEDAQHLIEHAERQTVDPSVSAAARLAGLQVKLVSAPEGVPDAIRSECAEAIPLFEQGADRRRLALAWHVLAQAEFADLRVQAAVQAWENAAAQAHLAGDRAFELMIRVESAERTGLERSSSSAAVREKERLAEEFPGEPALQLFLEVARAWDAYHAGRREQARPLVPEVLELSHRLGVPWHAALQRACFGWFEMLNGDLDEAERLADAGIDELRQLGARSWLGLALALLAEIRIARGRYADALELAGESEEYGGHDRMTRICARAARARAHAHLGELEEAKAVAAEAVALAETTDSFFRQADAQYALAETLAAADELPAALAAANEAGRLYTKLERTLLAQRASALAKEIQRRTAPIDEPTTAV